MRKKKQIIEIGSKYNNLTVESFSHSDKRFRKFYNTICECGNKKTIMGSAMVSGNTKSCGCLTSKYHREHHLLPDNLGVIRQIILQYKRHAKTRGYLWQLSENTFKELILSNCHYCGLKPSNIKNTKNYTGFLYSGVDRVNSDIGYIEKNVVACCNNCNKAKLAMSKSDFLDWIKRAYEHSIK